MKISVIVPVYNAEKYIKRCLDSIIGQTYTNIEVIAVDDGSTDNSPAILSEYAKRDSRIMVFHQENLGVAEARNRGLIEATGDFVLFVDSDDYIMKNTCEVAIDAIKNYQYDTVVFQYQIKYADGKSRIPLKFYNDKWDSGTEEALIDFLYYGRAMGTGVWNKLYMRSIIKENNINFYKLKIGEDTIFNLDYVRHSKKWGLVNNILYSYCMNSDSAMHQKDEKAIRSMVDLMEAYSDNSQKNRDSPKVLGAISTFCVRDLFTISKFGYEMNRGFMSRFKWFKKNMKSKKLFSYIEKADIDKLPFKFKLVYFGWKYNCALIIMLMVKLYFITVDC